MSHTINGQTEKAEAVEKRLKAIVQPPESEVTLGFEDTKDLNRHRKPSRHPHSDGNEHPIQQIFMNYRKNDKHHIKYTVVTILIWLTSNLFEEDIFVYK